MTAANPPAPGDVDDLSFEQARDELVRVVAALEQGAPTLEESLRLWERGEALAARCEQWLVGAKERLDAAIARRMRADGAVSLCLSLYLCIGAVSAGCCIGAVSCCMCCISCCISCISCISCSNCINCI